QSALEFRRVDIRVASIFLKMSNDYIHDDPIALETWIERVGQNSAANEHIIEILRQIQYLTPRTWPIFLAGLQHGSKPAQLALLESLCRLATLSNRLPAEHRPVIAKIVRSFPADLFADINVLLEPENKIGMVAVAIAEQGLTEAREVTRTADEMLRGKATTLAQVLATEDEVELFKQLDRIGDTFYRRLDGSEPESDYGAAVILDNPTAFPVLLQCLTVTLEQGRPESMWFQKTKALLTVTAKALRLLPSAFARHAEPGRLEPLLTRVVRTSEHANSRRAAITLLSHLRRITKRTVEAFLFALRDDMHVQETALQATERLTLSPEMRASVLQALDDDSAIVAAGAARMLSVIGRQERTPAPVRQEFLAALAAAIQDRKARRAVYRFTGHGNKEEDAIRVGRFGRLDQEFYQAVLHITGVGITV
ncbi:MAG TPA: hypothetical protein VFE62_15790, partial [Gemmataceae bacterium]|nr:hypothetical protein [Gemmataceae bacterium]